MPQNADAAAYYHELSEAFAQSGCAICRLSAQTANQYIDSLLWEMVNDPQIRQELNQARGYCQQHAWMLVRGGAALGVAILMQDVIKTLLNTLQSNRIEPEPGSALKHLWQTLDNNNQREPTARLVADLSPQVPCPICTEVQLVEDQYFDTLLDHLSGPDSLSDVYRSSEGLCLPHFRQALKHASPGVSLTALIEAQQAIWQRLNADLGEFIRKNDYRYSSEPLGGEKDSWLRALQLISGVPLTKWTQHKFNSGNLKDYSASA